MPFVPFETETDLEHLNTLVTFTSVMVADDMCLTRGNRLSFETTAACDNITRRDRDKKKDEPTETQSTTRMTRKYL